MYVARTSEGPSWQCIEGAIFRRLYTRFPGKVMQFLLKYLVPLRILCCQLKSNVITNTLFVSKNEVRGGEEACEDSSFSLSSRREKLSTHSLTL